MIKAILFDLDNTLLDFMRMKGIATERAAYAMVDAGLKMDVETASRELFDTYLEVGIESQNAFSEFLKNKTGEVDDRILAAGINAYLKTKESFIEPYPRTVPTLIHLTRQGYKLAIVSDAPRLKALQRLNAMGIQHFFDVVVCLEDTGEAKPSKMPFVKALEKLKVEASEVLMVGDWPEKDIQGAKKLGIKTVFARYGHWRGEIKESGADFEIGSIEGILGVLGLE